LPPIFHPAQPQKGSAGGKRKGEVGRVVQPPPQPLLPPSLLALESVRYKRGL
jgi:hypothetical protein